MKTRDDIHGSARNSTSETGDTPSAQKRVVAGMTIGVTSYDHQPIYAGADGTYGDAVDAYIAEFYKEDNHEGAMISEIRLELDIDAQRALRDLARRGLYA